MKRPTVVCLCGSTKFKEAFEKANLQETLAGRIVLTVGAFMHHESIAITPEQKRALDELHLAKIDLAEEVLCINVNDYIGSSTRRELWYAMRMDRRIRMLETPTRHTNNEIRNWFASWEDWEDAANEAAAVPIAEGASRR